MKPQDIEAKGSVIWGDNHIKSGSGGDSLKDEGRPMNIWTNGGARSFEDRMTLDFDSNDLVPAVGSMLVFSARLIQTATSAAMLVLVVTKSELRRFNAMPRSHEWGFSAHAEAGDAEAPGDD